MALFVSLTATAQIKTGGGPDEANSYGDDEILVDKHLGLLVNELKENDYKCSKSPKLKFEQNIVQIYVKLAILENLQKPSEECEEANRYLACLKSKASVNHAREILAVKKSVPYLSGTLKITPEETRKILKYFSKPERKKK